MIDPKKQYKTRDGREVRIYAVDGADPYPVHGAIKDDGKWCGSAWRADGGYLTHFNLTDPNDLIEVRPRIQRELWVNVYGSDTAMFFDCRASKAEADLVGGQRRACAKVLIDCEEGEGL